MLQATGSNNVADGNNSLFNNTTASDNIALGTSALLFGDTTGALNVALGVNALRNETTGSSNPALVPVRVSNLPAQGRCPLTATA